jgi:hypothetical protein
MDSYSYIIYGSITDQDSWQRCMGKRINRRRYKVVENYSAKRNFQCRWRDAVWPLSSKEKRSADVDRYFEQDFFGEKCLPFWKWEKFEGEGRMLKSFKLQ